MTQTHPEPGQPTAELLEATTPPAPKKPSGRASKDPTLGNPPVLLLDPADIDEDPDNARRTFDPAKLQSLAESLKERQMDEIHVRSPAGQRRVLVDGARRLRAAKLAGVQLRAKDWGDVDHKTAVRLAATSVLEKEGLAPYEEGLLYQRLLDAGMKKKEIQEQYKIPFNTLDSRLQLLKLPEQVAALVSDARGAAGTVFGLGHAQALLPLKDQPALLEAAKTHFLTLLAEGDLPTAENAPLAVAQALVQAGLVRETSLDTIGSLRYEVPDFQKQLEGLAHVDLELSNGHTRVLYVDPAAFDARLKQIHDRRAEELKAEKARERKKSVQDQQKLDRTASKAEQAAQDRAEAHLREEERQELILGHVGALQREAIPSHLSKKDKLATAAWVILADTAADLSTRTIEECAHVAGMAVGLEVDPGADLTYQMDNEVELKAPKWFAGMAAPKQLTFIVAFHAARIAHDAELSEVLTGHGLDHYIAKAEKAVEQAVPKTGGHVAKAKAKPTAKPPAAAEKAATSNSKRAGKKSRTRNAPAKAKTAAKKDPPGVVKAKAKRAQGAKEPKKEA